MWSAIGLAMAIHIGVLLCGQLFEWPWLFTLISCYLWSAIGLAMAIHIGELLSVVSQRTGHG